MQHSPDRKRAGSQTGLQIRQSWISHSRRFDLYETSQFIHGNTIASGVEMHSSLTTKICWFPYRLARCDISLYLSVPFFYLITLYGTSIFIKGVLCCWGDFGFGARLRSDDRSVTTKASSRPGEKGGSLRIAAMSQATIQWHRNPPILWSLLEINVWFQFKKVWTW